MCSTTKKPSYFVILEDLESAMIKAQQASAEGREDAKVNSFTTFSAYCSSLERFEDIPAENRQIIVEKLENMLTVLQREAGYGNFQQKLRTLISNMKS